MSNENKHEELPSIVRYLLGEAAHDSLWYGDTPKDRRSTFWWRTNLREAWNESQSTISRLESDNRELKEKNEQLEEIIISDYDEVKKWQLIAVKASGKASAENYKIIIEERDSLKKQIGQAKSLLEESFEYISDFSDTETEGLKSEIESFLKDK